MLVLSELLAPRKLPKYPRKVRTPNKALYDFQKDSLVLIIEHLRMRYLKVIGTIKISIRSIPTPHNPITTHHSTLTSCYSPPPSNFPPLKRNCLKLILSNVSPPTIRKSPIMVGNLIGSSNTK